MATDSVMGLFASPEQYQQQQRQALYDQAVKEAQLDPYQQARVNLQTGVQGLAQTGAGMLGAQDPQMKLMTLRKQALQGLDPTDSAAINKAAQALAQAGDQQGAMQLAQRALDVRNVESQISGRTEEKQAQREMQMQMAREKIQSNIDIARERGATQLQIAQMMQDGRSQMAQLAASMKGDKAQVADDKAATRIGQNTVFENLIAEGTGLTSEIDKNKDAFSLSGRGTSAFQSIFNPDAPEVKVKSDVDSYLNKARNAYLLAAKGTQTEGDAQRAWSEFAGSLDFSSAAGAKRSVERITKELGTQKKANEAYLSSRGLRSEGQPNKIKKWSDL